METKLNNNNNDMSKYQKYHQYPTVWLIKLPPFVAKQWRTAVHRSTVGYIELDNPENKNLDKKTLLWLNTPVNNVSRLNISIFNPKNGYIIRNIETNHGMTYNITGRVDGVYNFSPAMDNNYRNVLRNRATDRTTGSRQTAEENRRPTDNLDTLTTIFKFYQPHTASVNPIDTNSTLQQADTSHKFVKAKRTVMMEEDSIRAYIFNSFERTGENGIVFKQLISETNQPQHILRRILDEVAIQRRRTSDKKLVYYLKDELAAPKMETNQDINISNHEQENQQTTADSLIKRVRRVT